MIQLPPSKSIGARFLVGTYFAGTLPADPFFEDNDDLVVMQQALLEILSDEEPIDYGDSQIDAGASGTALRFVTAVCASSPGADYIITGTPRLMKRPMAPMLDLLREAGAEIQCLGEDETGPYRVKGGKLEGGTFSIRGDISSQFISALMLVAPTWEKGLKLNFTTPLVSRPYVEMTAQLMEAFSLKTELTDFGVTVARGEYRQPKDFRVEADWSSASFFYEACALGAKDVVLENLVSPSLSWQGDKATADIFGRIGVESQFTKEGANLTFSGKYPPHIEINFNDFPDLLLPYAVSCLCLGVKFRFTGAAHLRHKESDRLASLQKEALKLGFKVKAGDDFLEWDGEMATADPDPLISTYDDHRVAMAFAPVALKTGRIRIEHPEVVAKSFVDFWNQAEKVGLECKSEGNVMIVTKKTEG